MSDPVVSRGVAGASPADPIADPPPPGLGSWRRVYALVLGWLALLVLLMYAFTLRYR